MIDASVAVEYLLRTELGRSLEDRLAGEDLAAPSLLDAEVLAVVRRACLRQRIGVERAEQALSDLYAWPVRRLAERELLHRAFAFRDNVSAYDALYVAAAAALQVPLLTADGPLARAPSLGVLVENVRM